MRNVFVFFISVIVLISCKKDNITTSAPPANYTDKIILNDLQATSDSVVITWSILNNPGFINYTLIRKDDPTATGTVIATVYDSQNVKFVDKTVPYTPYLEYQVIGNLRTGERIQSNIEKFQRSDIKILKVSPFDIQFDDQTRQVYFFEKTGTISIYSLQTNEFSRTINTGATIGFCDFGVYNGVKELYVPRNDGWVFVYNAQTLQLIDQINVGLESSCVVFNNNNLYVSTSAWTNRPLKVYSRITKSKISETGDFDLTRFKKIPNSNTELLEITINIGPVDQDYYSFDANGNIIQHLDDFYHGDYPLDYRIFEFFPSGNKYITSSSGAIYTKNMVFEATLPRGSLEFTSFYFDVPQRQIYCGTTSKTIEVYSELDYTHIRSISTKTNPYRIFKDGNNGLVCLSSSSYDYNLQAPKNIIVEKIQ
jgi:hypothetical protein